MRLALAAAFPVAAAWGAAAATELAATRMPVGRRTKEPAVRQPAAGGVPHTADNGTEPLPEVLQLHAQNQKELYI